jgi:WD40 repeat protein
LKIFDILSGKVSQNLEGHTEEILCLKRLSFKNNNYYLTGSYDGSMIKWIEKNNKITKFQTIMDGISNVIFSISFLPKCDNKFFIAGCDDKIKLFDFEFGELIQVFER